MIFNEFRDKFGNVRIYAGDAEARQFFRIGEGGRSVDTSNPYYSTPMTPERAQTVADVAERIRQEGPFISDKSDSWSTVVAWGLTFAPIALLLAFWMSH